MNLQDWFYLVGIIFMTLGSVFMLALVWLAIFIGDQVKKIRLEAEIKTEELKLALEDMSKRAMFSPWALVPIGWRIIRRMIRKRL